MIIKRYINNVVCCLIVFFGPGNIGGVCHGQANSLSPEIKQQTIKDLAALLPERYAYKEIGIKLQRLLEENLKAGKYASFTSPTDFGIAVTADLRSLNSDRHLALNLDPQPETATPAAQAQIL